MNNQGNDIPRTLFGTRSALDNAVLGQWYINDRLLESMALRLRGTERTRSTRALVVLMVVLVLTLSVISVTAEDSEPTGPVKAVFTVPMPGVSSELNNIVETSAGILVAPFAPFGLTVEDLEEKEFFKLPKLDNHFLYLINPEDPLATPKSIDLGCYWPTKLHFDEATRTAFVRGTAYLSAEEGGDPYPAEVIAYIHVSDKGEFDPRVLTIPIKAVGDADPTALFVSTEEKWASSAPDEFVLGRQGKFVIFTNGASIYSFSTVEGYVNRSELIPASEYSLDNSITSLDINDESNTVVVVVSQKTQKKGNWKNLSDLYFFRLNENGSFELITKVGRESLPDKIALAPGDTVAMSVDLGSGSPDFAFAVTNDGTLYRISISDGAVKPIAFFPELATGDGEQRAPRSVTYDPLSRSVGIVEHGRRLQISRPAFGRKGRNGKVSRSFALNRVLESPAVAVAQIGNKGKVSSSTVIVDFGIASDSVSNLAFDEEARGLFATSTGRLFSIEVASGALSQVAELGVGVDSITYNVAGLRLAGIKSFAVDEATGEFIDVRDGAVVIAQLAPRSTAGERIASIVASPGGFSRIFAGLFSGKPDRLVASSRRPFGFVGHFPD